MRTQYSHFLREYLNVALSIALMLMYEAIQITPLKNRVDIHKQKAFQADCASKSVVDHSYKKNPIEIILLRIRTPIDRKNIVTKNLPSKSNIVMTFQLRCQLIEFQVLQSLQV